MCDEYFDTWLKILTLMHEKGCKTYEELIQTIADEYRDLCLEIEHRTMVSHLISMF